MSTRSIARGLHADNHAVVTRSLRRIARMLGTDAEHGGRKPDWQANRDALAEADVEARLLALADDDDNAVRELAVDGLAVWTGDAALEKLLARCNDEVSEVRASAVGGLVAWPEDLRALDSLVAAMDDGNWTVRWRSARALAAFADKEAEHALFRALLDPDSNVRCTAAEALESHDPAVVLPRLRSYFDHPTAHMLDAALDLMGAIGGADDAKFLSKVGAWTNLSQPSQVRRWARDASKRIKARLKQSGGE